MISLMLLFLAAACAPTPPANQPPASKPAPTTAPAVTQGAQSAAPASTVQTTVPTAQPAAGQPKFGGIYQYVLTTEPTTWDPHLSELKTVHDQGLIYPRLVQYKSGPGTDPNVYITAPDLAERWEQLDDKTYVFYLKKTGKWSREAPLNGRPIVADDVVYSFKRLASEASAYRTNWDALDKVEALDPHTVKFTLKYPFAPFYAYVAYHASRIVAREVVEECGDLKKVECAAKVGGGPFLLEKYEQGVQVVYKKNPDYYDAPKPYIDGIVAPIITDASVREAAFTAKKIYSGVSFSSTRAATLKASLPDLQWVEQGTAHYQVHFNVTRKPWDNPKVRLAVSKAINRQQFIDTALFGAGRLETPSRVWFSDSALGVDEIKQLVGEDVAEAKRLLAEAGFPDGFDGGKLLNAPGGGSTDQAALVADMLKRNLNITLQVEPAEYAAGWDRYQKGDFGIAYGVHPRSYPDPDDYIFARYRSGAVRNYSGCNDAKLDQLLDQQRLLADVAQRGAVIKEADRYFITQVACAIQVPSTTDFWPAWGFVKNFSQHISFGAPDLTNVWLDLDQ